MKIEIIAVTPDIATKWLATNADNNRKISKKMVNTYARDMIAGTWEMTGEAIKFDTTGRLIDGQHRLSAVIAAHKTVNMAVITGLEPSVMDVIDTGKSRSAGDALTIHGAGQHANHIAALARKIIGYKTGDDGILEGKKIRMYGQPITNRDILELCERLDLVPYVKFAYRMTYNQVARIFSHGEWAFIYWRLCEIDPADAESFLEKLATLENVSSTSPIRTLFEKMVQSKVRLGSKQILMATISAWNAWRTGQNLHVIRVSHMDDAIPRAV